MLKWRETTFVQCEHVRHEIHFEVSYITMQINLITFDIRSTGKQLSWTALMTDDSSTTMIMLVCVLNVNVKMFM